MIIKTKENREDIAKMALHYANIEWPNFYWETEVEDKNIKIKCTVAPDRDDECTEECIFEYDGTYWEWYQLADQIRWHCHLTQANATEKYAEKHLEKT